MTTPATTEPQARATSAGRRRLWARARCDVCARAHVRVGVWVCECVGVWVGGTVRSGPTFNLPPRASSRAELLDSQMGTAPGREGDGLS